MEFPLHCSSPPRIVSEWVELLGHRLMNPVTLTELKSFYTHDWPRRHIFYDEKDLPLARSITSAIAGGTTVAVSKNPIVVADPLGIHGRCYAAAHQTTTILLDPEFVEAAEQARGGPLADAYSFLGAQTLDHEWGHRSVRASKRTAMPPDFPFASEGGRFMELVTRGAFFLHAYEDSSCPFKMAKLTAFTTGSCGAAGVVPDAILAPFIRRLLDVCFWQRTDLTPADVQVPWLPATTAEPLRLDVLPCEAPVFVDDAGKRLNIFGAGRDSHSGAVLRAYESVKPRYLFAPPGRHASVAPPGPHLFARPVGTDESVKPLYLFVPPVGNGDEVA